MASEITIRQDLSPESLEAIRRIITDTVRAVQAEHIRETLLSPAEACKVFRPAVSKQTLHTWTKDGKLKSYSMGRNIYYKYSEVIEAAKELKLYKRT